MANMQKLMKENDWALHCSICGKNVFLHPLDYFMVKDKIWNKVCNNDYISSERVLCRECTEKILGRELTNKDFTDAPINYEYIDEHTYELKNKIYNYYDREFNLKLIMDKLKQKGYDIQKQPNKNVWQINNINNLRAITVSISPIDYHISFWQDDTSVQMAVKSVDILYNFISNLTW